MPRKIGFQCPRCGLWLRARGTTQRTAYLIIRNRECPKCRYTETAYEMTARHFDDCIELTKKQALKEAAKSTENVG